MAERPLAKPLYQTFLKRGMSKDEAFFAVVDHFNRQHWYDRDLYNERIKSLEDKLARLEKDEA